MSSQIVSRDPVEVKWHSSIRSRSASLLCMLGIYADSPTSAEPYTGRFPDVHIWCTRLGMLPNAVEDWAMWHANPATAMIWFFTAQCALPCKNNIVTLFVLVASLQKVLHDRSAAVS
jgi:hypothetical protein